MDWSKGFQPERKATWDEIAEAIHDAVTMSEVVARYAPSASPRYNRIPCPLHHGKDYNFSYTRYGYKCFVCGASGDVITFVKEVCELSTRVDAMRKINDDFNLHLPIDGEVKVNFRERIDERRAEREKLDAEQEAWEENYNRLTEEYCILDDIVMNSLQITAVEQAKQRRSIVEYLIEHLPIEPKKRGYKKDCLLNSKSSDVCHPAGAEG